MGAIIGQILPSLIGSLFKGKESNAQSADSGLNLNSIFGGSSGGGSNIIGSLVQSIFTK